MTGCLKPVTGTTLLKTIYSRYSYNSFELNDKRIISDGYDRYDGFISTRFIDLNICKYTYIHIYNKEGFITRHTRHTSHFPFPSPFTVIKHRTIDFKTV